VIHAMTRLARAGLFTGFGLVIALVGCSSPDPVLYTIAPVNGAAKVAGPRIVSIERLEIARYLDRSQIVSTSENYRLDLKPNDWWGEPLAAMLRRVLQQELGQRLPQSSILSGSGAVSATPDATIDLDLQRLDVDASGALILQAEVSVTFKGAKAPVLRSFHLSSPVSGQGAGAEVAAISGAVGQLADGLAAMLAGR
jgi:uncharacterized lipoprotein YmbA